MTVDLQLPDSQLVRDAEALARAVSSDMLFNHVMRCYFHRVLTEELDSKQPYHHFFHICTHLQHARTPVTIPDASALLNAAPFNE